MACSVHGGMLTRTPPTVRPGSSLSPYSYPALGEFYRCKLRYGARSPAGIILSHQYWYICVFSLYVRSPRVPLIFDGVQHGRPDCSSDPRSSRSLPLARHVNVAASAESRTRLWSSPARYPSKKHPMAPHTEVVTVPDSSSVLSTDGETPRFNGDDLLLSLYLVALFERLPKAVSGARTF